jgi:hypothetical protein
MTALDRFDRLVSEYLDEALDGEGVAELGTLLASRPEYAARFVRLSRLHGGLRELHRPAPAPGVSGVARAWAAVLAILAVLLLGVLLVFKRFGRG